MNKRVFFGKEPISTQKSRSLHIHYSSYILTLTWKLNSSIEHSTWRKNSCDNLLLASVFLLWCRHTYFPSCTSYFECNTLWCGNFGHKKSFSEETWCYFVSWRFWSLFVSGRKCIDCVNVTQHYQYTSKSFQKNALIVL